MSKRKTFIFTSWHDEDNEQKTEELDEMFNKMSDSLRAYSITRTIAQLVTDTYEFDYMIVVTVPEDLSDYVGCSVCLINGNEISVMNINIPCHESV